MGSFVIDKLDIRIPRNAPFTPSFQRKYAELQALEKGPFRAGKLYEYAGDLREYGHNLRLNLYCQMDKVGNHKIELIDVGTMNRTAIMREVGEIFEVGAASLGVMRVDFAVDCPGLPLQWFRETVRVQHKRFRSAITSDPFYSEMGTGGIQTLYFGKRPNVFRIYDKRAEYQTQFQTLIRKMGPGFDGTFESVFPGVGKDSILTRVERQIGARIPMEIETLAKLFESGFEFKPFQKLKIIAHAGAPEFDSSLSFETYCTAKYLSGMAEENGMHGVKEFVSKRSNGNSGWVWKKYGPLLAAATPGPGISEAELQNRFEQSMRHQLTA
jgi:hypothetical protein